MLDSHTIAYSLRNEFLIGGGTFFKNDENKCYSMHFYAKVHLFLIPPYMS